MKLLFCTFLVISSLYASINLKNIDILKQQSQAGNIKANFELGKYYYKKHNLDLAMIYFKKAAIYDDPKAIFNIAIIYANKKYRYFNYKKSLKFFKQLALDNYAPAQYMLGMIFLYGINKDYTKAKNWFEYAFFENHYKKASCQLAYMYIYGKGVLVNLGRANKLTKYGLKENLPLCKQLYKEFHLYKYKKDKGFKFGYYKKDFKKNR